MTDLTCVIVLKNRDKQRVENCIRSIRQQNYLSKIIVVDYGSDEENVSWEKKIIPDAITKLILVKTNNIFNKSRALNIGIKHADTKYVLMTDIDCILSENFTETVVSELEKGKNVILCQKVDLDISGHVIGYHEPSASGSCIGITREWLIKVHGFDETYTFWGREDNDLVDRAVEDGHTIVWITDKVRMFHQWHGPPPVDSLEENVKYYNIPNKPLVRNGEIWGVL